MDYRIGFDENGRIPNTKSDLLTVSEIDELTSFVNAKQKRLQEKLQNQKIRGFRLKKIEKFSKEDRTYGGCAFEGLDYNGLTEIM